MPPVTLGPGESRTILPSAAQAPATPFKANTSTYWLRESGGLIIRLIVTAVTSGGSITDLNAMDKDGNLAVPLTSLGITATGTYIFCIAPGATAAANWKAFAATYPPTEGLIQTIAADNKSITYSIQLECVGR